jgi:hypothetical protein
MKTLIGKVSDDFNEKRFYFEGKITVACPNCKMAMVNDFEEDYLSYPKIGENDLLYFCCDGCGKDWEMPIIVKSIEVTVDYDDTKITE